MFEELFWQSVYRVYPPVLRALERAGVHAVRQEFLIGRLRPQIEPAELASHLKSKGFEPAILAWRDPGEILGVRKLERKVFQYHLRLFSDGELRGHYEHSSEGNPWAHVTGRGFEARDEYFRQLLGAYLSI